MKRIYITSLIFAFLFIIAIPSASEAYYGSNSMNYYWGDNYNSFNNYSDYNGYNIYYVRPTSGPKFTSNYINNAYPNNNNRMYGYNYNVNSDYNYLIPAQSKFTSNYMNNAYPYNQYGSNYNSYDNYNNYNNYGNYNNYQGYSPRYNY